MTRPENVMSSNANAELRGEEWASARQEETRLKTGLTGGRCNRRGRYSAEGGSEETAACERKQRWPTRQLKSLFHPGCSNAHKALPIRVSK